MMKNKIMPTVVLVTICVAAALLLSVINYFTAPIIRDREDGAKFDALYEVLPKADGKKFDPLTIHEGYPRAIVSGYSSDVGFVFEAKGSGLQGDIVVMVGVDSNGKIVGTKIVSESETPSYGNKVYPLVEGLGGEYAGVDGDTFTEYIVSGATYASRGFAQAIEAALNAYIVAKGGAVDDRTPEEILQDNCNAALGTTGLTFTRWFATETLDGIDAVYEIEGGRVFVIGELFVGVKADGTLATAGVDDATAAKAIAANTTINQSTLTAVEIPAGINKTIVKKIAVTDSGNYVFELAGQGYAAWDGVPISIKVSISTDGKIINCVTTHHSESVGIGDVCDTEDYCNSWNGASDEDVKITIELGDIDEYGDPKIPSDCTDIGAIAGASYTTYGYQSAIKAAFKAFNALTATTEGGNE